MTYIEAHGSSQNDRKNLKALVIRPVEDGYEVQKSFSGGHRSELDHFSDGDEHGLLFYLADCLGIELSDDSEESEGENNHV